MKKALAAVLAAAMMVTGMSFPQVELHAADETGETGGTDTVAVWNGETDINWAADYDNQTSFTYGTVIQIESNLSTTGEELMKENYTDTRYVGSGEPVTVEAAKKIILQDTLLFLC